MTYKFASLLDQYFQVYDFFFIIGSTTFSFTFITLRTMSELYYIMVTLYVLKYIIISM